MERRSRNAGHLKLRSIAATGVLVAAMACGGGSSAGPTGTPCQGLGLFTLSLERATIEIGETTHGTVIARGCGGTAVSIAALTWESSQPTIAVIGFEGAIIGHAVGNAQITAHLGEATASAAISVVEPTPPMGGPVSGFTLQVFSPMLGAVVDDSVRVLAAVSPQGPLARVAGTLGPKEFALHSIPVGAFGLGEAWEARVRVNDLAAGNYKVVVRAFNMAGDSAKDSVVFERRLLNTGGTGTGATGNKILSPAKKRP